MKNETKKVDEKKDSIFQERLNELIQESRKSQKDLADYVGITRQSISLYAAGKRTPDIDILNKICDYFRVSADYLLGRINLKSSNIDDRSINKRLGLSDEAISILEHCYSYSCPGNDSFTSTVNFLIEQEYPLTFQENWRDIYYYKDLLEEEGVDKEEIDEIIKNKEIEWNLEVEKWSANHISIISKIEDYFLVSIDKDNLYITEKAINKASDFKNEKFRAYETLRAVDVNKIVDQVFLSEIQETLKQLKVNYLKTRTIKPSISPED